MYTSQEDSSRLPFMHGVRSLTEKHLPFTVAQLEEQKPGFTAGIERIYATSIGDRTNSETVKWFAKRLSRDTSLHSSPTVMGAALINSNHEIVAGWTEQDKRIFLEALCNREVDKLWKLTAHGAEIFGEKYGLRASAEVVHALWVVNLARLEDRKAFSSLLMKRTTMGRGPESI